MKSKHHWGTFIWSYIHTICIIENLPNNVIEQVSKNIINLLKSIKLPCDTCQLEFTSELNLLNENKEWNHTTLFYWSVDFHNKINIKLNKNIYNHYSAHTLWIT